MKGKNSRGFSILPITEENMLTGKALEEYYGNLRTQLKNRKLTNTTKGATTIAPHLKGITEWIARKVVKLLAIKNVLVTSSGQENIPDGAVIFACTHQGILDNFVWISETPKHCLILHGAFVNPLLIACQVNTGLVMVSKRDNDRENRQNAKLDMVTLLLNGHSIWYFPEGTWNLSPNKMHLPMKFGVMDVARKANAPIVPVVIENTYDSSSGNEVITAVQIRYGKPIDVGVTGDLQEKLEEYSTAISTIRFTLMENKGEFKRSEILPMEYANYIKGSLKNLKMGKLDIDEERRHIWGAENDFYLFHHINDVPFDEKGRLMEGDEIRRLREIDYRRLFRY